MSTPWIAARAGTTTGASTCAGRRRRPPFSLACAPQGFASSDGRANTGSARCPNNERRPLLHNPPSAMPDAMTQPDTSVPLDTTHVAREHGKMDERFLRLVDAVPNRTSSARPEPDGAYTTRRQHHRYPWSSTATNLAPTQPTESPQHSAPPVAIRLTANPRREGRGDPDPIESLARRSESACRRAGRQPSPRRAES